MNKPELGLVFFPAFDWAISPSHPEREERLLYTRDQIVEEGLLDLKSIREYKPRIAAMKDLDRVHIGVPGLDSLITDAHLVSAGGAITAAEAMIRGEVKRSFALVRPPGLGYQPHSRVSVSSRRWARPGFWSDGWIR